ncbi:hypothetical protein ACX40Y_09580 [Sphingomonas sp. RS6]
MASITDPARELGEIAERLTKSSNNAGDKYLASQFGVEPWSTDFFKIIACICERIDAVSKIVGESGLDDDHRAKALDHLANFKSGFTGDSLRKAWNEAGIGLTAMKDHGSPIQFLSQTVRPIVSYPRLSDDEVEELITLIDTYLAELNKSDEGPPFVRQAIFDGMTVFKFQLEKIGWMGTGYALAAFREVVFVYEAYHRTYTGDGNPDAEAFFKGFVKILRTFQSKVDEAKGWKDTAETVIDAYKLTSSWVAPVLLTHQFLLPSS